MFMNNVVSILGPIFLGVAVFALLWCVGVVVECRTRRATRGSARGKGADPSKMAWPERFLLAFDTLFRSGETGRPKLSIVVMVSLLAIGVILFGWVAVRPTKALDTLEVPITSIMLAYVAVLYVPANYFSLWKTRVVVSRIAQCRGRVAPFVLLLGDGAGSGIIYFAGVALGTAPLAMLYAWGMGRWDWVAVGLHEFIAVASDLFLEGAVTFSSSVESLNLVAMFLYATCLGSVWLWTYRIGTAFCSVLSGVHDYFSVERNPVAAPMMVGSAFFGVLAALLAICM